MSGRNKSANGYEPKSDSSDTVKADLSLTQCAKVPKIDHPYVDMGAELVDFFQNAPIALHWLSGAGVIIWANDSELKALGYSADEYIGHTITEFLMPGEELHLQEVLGNLAAGRTIHDKPFRFRAKNGDVKYLIVDSNVNFNEDGSFRHTRYLSCNANYKALTLLIPNGIKRILHKSHIILLPAFLPFNRCFIRNDTDRRVKEEILMASNRIMAEEADAKGAFIRHVFHEMRTPLHVLSTFLNSVNPSAEDFEEMRHHTGAIIVTGMIDVEGYDVT